MESKLKKKKVRIFKDIHSSGHASREDIRELIELVKPKHVIPAHGGPDKVEPLIDLAVEMGYKRGKTAHLMKNKKVIEI